MVAVADFSFQFTPARGGRLRSRRTSRMGQGFNSRPRVAGDGTNYHHAANSNRFNSRPRVAGDRRATAREAQAQSFNSRPRVAGDPVGVLCLCAAQRVSIHARAWRATVAASASFAVLVFQFTPARGGRRASASRTNKHWSFNSRPRVAGDIHPPTNPLGKQVSIHARAWRATQSPRKTMSRNGFQFTPARGGRPIVLGFRHLPFQFQFTPARGGRLRTLPRFSTGNTFQFTPARGGRPRREASSSSIRVSIHARAWRATCRGGGGGG